MSLLAFNIVGKGKPVVLLHGFLENKNMWDFLSYLDDNELQFIMIDLPGHGNSEVYNPVNTMEFMAEKVFEVLNKEGIHSYHVLGHSMGGYVALAMAEQNPKALNSLGLLFSHPFADSKAKKEQRTKAAELAEENKDSFIRLGVRGLFNPHHIDRLSTQVEQATEMAMQNPKDGIAPALLGMRDRPDRSAVLENTICPKLWIYGEYDTVVSHQKIEDYLKDKDAIQDYRLPIGHMGHLESPEICATVIHEFLSQL